MNSSSERLVVFVTPAQKRVLTARAARLGISLSELVRRAVLAFDDTGEEVRAAGLVDRLGASQSRIADSEALRRLAAGQGNSSHASSPARTRGCPGADNVTPLASEPPCAEDQTAPLPVAAAVARALAAQADGQADAAQDMEDEAVVARIIATESGDLSRF